MRSAATLLALAAGSVRAAAGTFSQKDVQILAKAIGFLEPPPSGAATVAIAYDRPIVVETGCRCGRSLLRGWAESRRRDAEAESG